MDWYVAIVTLVFGVIFGGGCGIYLARASNSAAKRAKALDAELKQTRDELVAFKGQVTQHFSKTAELVNALTANYRSVYSHLAEGAQRFSSNDAIKIETMNTADPLLSSNARSDGTETVDLYNNTVAEEKVDEGWYGDHPADVDIKKSMRDDKFH